MSTNKNTYHNIEKLDFYVLILYKIISKPAEPLHSMLNSGGYSYFKGDNGI